MVQLSNTSNFICDHQSFCHPNCYERQRRGCSRLMKAVQRVYESDKDDPPPVQEPDNSRWETDSHKDSLRDKLKRRVSLPLVGKYNKCVYDFS